MSELVDARWVGPSGYTLVDGTSLEPGVTVCKIGHGEASASDHWEVVDASEKPPATSGKSSSEKGS